MIMNNRKTLAELKGEAVALRNKIESRNGILQDVLDLNTVCGLIKGIEKFLLGMAVCIILLIGGCKVGGAVGMDCEVFYPQVETPKGGKFGDPDKSRKQSTQHTIGMARNNLPMVGGAE